MGLFPANLEVTLIAPEKQQAFQGVRVVPALKGAQRRCAPPSPTQIPSTASPPCAGTGGVNRGVGCRRERQGRVVHTSVAGRQAGSRLSALGNLKVCGNVEGFRAGQQETTQSSGLGRSLPLLCLLLPPPLPPRPAKAVSVSHFSLPLLVVGCPGQTSQRRRLPPGFWGCCLNGLTECQGWKGLRSHLEQPPRCSKGNRGREGARDCPRAPRGRAKAKCLDFMTTIFTGAQPTPGHAEKGKAI